MFYHKNCNIWVLKFSPTLGQEQVAMFKYLIRFCSKDYMTMKLQKTMRMNSYIVILMGV